jgi:hypothetical protein
VRAPVSLHALFMSVSLAVGATSRPDGVSYS